jgi:NAD+ diphosphatase
LENRAFYFQNESLLLPFGTEFAPAAMETSLDKTCDFPLPDVFTVPEIAGSGKESSHTRVISCVFVPPNAPLPPAWQAISVRQVLSLLPNCVTNGTSPAARMIRAFHIAQWRRESQFCGSCGGKNIDSPDEIARLCPVCGRMEFPRITPAVITIILNDEGKILLAHNKKFADGLYSLIAGFTEAGENLEAAVAREIREEVGIEIRDIRYALSQPWPFPHSLMMGFTARHASGTIQPDGIEIEDARWFGKDDLPRLPGPGSVSRDLINRWLDGNL